MASSPVVVIGSSNTDMVVQTPRLPAPGETVLGGDLLLAPGGKGANQAVAAARLGAPVTFVARVGRDMFGEQAIANFERENLDIQYLKTDPDKPSGVALILVEPEGENIIAVAPGANSHLAPADIEEARVAFSKDSIVLLQLETPMETVLEAARMGKQAGCHVILNPAPARRLPSEMYSIIDLLTPNETEAEQITGGKEPEDAAHWLLGQGVRTVIITLGSAGALVADGEKGVRRVPGFRVKAVDTTAAGDAFNGGLAACLGNSSGIDAAVRYAHAAAAISVTRLGAQPSLPNRKEVEQLLEES